MSLAGGEDQGRGSSGVMGRGEAELGALYSEVNASWVMVTLDPPPHTPCRQNDGQTQLKT